jgi:hypothetical protein
MTCIGQQVDDVGSPEDGFLRDVKDDVAYFLILAPWRRSAFWNVNTTDYDRDQRKPALPRRYIEFG